MKPIKLKLVAALVGAASYASTLLAQNIGQWDFNSGDLSQTAGANLGPITYNDGPGGQTFANTVFGSTTTLGVPNINGTVANVMNFPAGALPEGFLISTPPGNGAGSLVNEYTIIMDVLYSQGKTLRPLLEMDNGSEDNINALWDIAADGSLQVTNTAGASSLPSGGYGSLTTNVWYRLALVLDESLGTATVYTNGTVLGVLNFGKGNIDSPFALVPSGFTPILSSVYTNAAGYVNSIQLRDSALNPGQIEALGGPSASKIPITLPPGHSYIVTRSPNVGEIGDSPTPAISVVVDPGAATIDSSTFALFFDGSPLTASVTSDTDVATRFDVNASENNILNPLSTHTVTLIYSDSLLGYRTNTWSFTVAQYQNVNLPAPVYFENFDEVPEGVSTNAQGVVVWNLPTGWSVTNATVSQTPGYDLTDGTSDAWLNWVVVNTNRLEQIASGEDGTYTSPVNGVNYTPVFGPETGPLRLVTPPIVLNGQLLGNLGKGNVIDADSDQRQNAGGQVNVLFTRDYDLTGVTNVYVKWNSLYEQNQDNIGSVEYSVDHGATLLPVLYILDNGWTVGDGSDVITNPVTGVIDPFATFGTPRNDQAYTLAYSNFIGAVVSTNLIPAIQGRAQDDPLNSKRIEVYRIPLADNASHVRFRFGQAGTSSWYFGMDDFGIYSIGLPVISGQPVGGAFNANSPVDLTVLATGSPLTYQWLFNSVAINGATNSSYFIPSVQTTNTGSYTVLVGGLTLSSPAVITVNTNPVITSDLAGEVADVGGSVTYNVAAIGGIPLTYNLYFNGNLIQSSPNGSFSLRNLTTADAGNYQLTVQNSFGSVQGALAALKVYAGPLNSNLVVHLKFDGDLTDSSGRGNDATYVYAGLIPPVVTTNGFYAGTESNLFAGTGTSGSLTARFSTNGMFGEAFEYTTTNDYSDIEYASLGYPPDLQLGTTNDFSVSFWCNYTNQGDDVPFISNKNWDSSSNLGWGIFTQGGGNYRINVTGQNGSSDKFSQTDTPSTLKDGHWHNVVVSVQRAPFGQQAYIYGYLDGKLVTKHANHVGLSIDTFGTPLTSSQNPTFGATNIDNFHVVPEQSVWAVNIGQDGTGVYTDNTSAHDINALIDDLGIWRRALTPNEAAAIYQAGLLGKDLSQVITPEQLFITVSGGNLNLNWVGMPTIKLQQSTSIHPAVWTDVAGTLGASSAMVPISNNSQIYFRLSNQ